jgi:VWFA-related protein
MMRALVTVIDENGIPVRGLEQKAFELDEDGRGAFTPDQVQVVANQKAAVSVTIVVDLSGTMRGKPLQAAKEAMGKFLEALLNEANDPDRAAFVGFGQKVNVTETTITDEKREVDFTNDMGKLLNVINFVDVDTGTGGTPLYDAIFRAVKITSQRPGRRAILLMTDGKDHGSTLTASDPIDEANRQRTPIFPIGLSTGQLDTQYLERLAVRTGGQFQSTTTPDELTQLFQNVLAQLKEQYVLTYSSRVPKVDSQAHSLTVQVTTPRGQGISKLTYTLGQPATPASVTGATPAPGTSTTPITTPAPAATPTLQPRGTNMMQWVSENIVLVMAIVVAAFLLLLMLVIAIVLVLRRRSAKPESEYAPPYTPPFPSSATMQGPPSAAGGPTIMPASPARARRGGASTGTPTMAAGSTTSDPGTQAAPSAPSPLSAKPSPFQPASPPPPPQFGAAPSPFKPSPTTGKPTEGVGVPGMPLTPAKTVLIQRGPQLKVIGILVDKKQSSRRFDIDQPAVTIGRAPGNTFIVDHPTVSRQHATIKIEGQDFRVYDLGSGNGTFVSDQRVREPVVLQDGVTVRFGEVEFIFKRVSLE